MISLSIALATFNEENNLSMCLDSVKNIADEIVVVDGSSTDKTTEIAKEYGAKIKITTNKSNFHINKQIAIDLATKDWILQLDADERITPELAKEIESRIRNPSTPLRTGQESGIKGYWIPRKNYFLGRFLLKGGQFPDYTLRLYKRGKGKLPQKSVHEQAQVAGEVSYLKNPLLHYPYKNFWEYLIKWNRYNSLLAYEIKEKMKNKSYVGKILYSIGYLLIKPVHWFLTTYIRHKGFMDSWQGFVFSLFSALRFTASYLKFLRI